MLSGAVLEHQGGVCARAFVCGCTCVNEKEIVLCFIAFRTKRLWFPLLVPSAATRVIPLTRTVDIQPGADPGLNHAGNAREPASWRALSDFLVLFVDIVHLSGHCAPLRHGGAINHNWFTPHGSQVFGWSLGYHHVSSWNDLISLL